MTLAAVAPPPIVRQTCPACRGAARVMTIHTWYPTPPCVRCRGLGYVVTEAQS